MDGLNPVLFFVATVSIVIYYVFFHDKLKERKYPPGPRGFPIVGSMLSLGTRPYLSLSKWAKEYGPVMMMNLGRSRTVVINDVKLIREAFNEQVFSGRPDNKLFHLASGGKHGLISSDGEEWLEQRRFTLRALRDFGFGRKSMDAMIMDEVTEIIDKLKKHSGEPVSVNRMFSLAILNSLWAIITSERYEHEDPKLNKILDTATSAVKDSGGGILPIFFPELAERFPDISGWNTIVRASMPLINIFEETVQNRIANPGDENNPRDFMDVYANEINKTKDPKSSFYRDYGIKSMTAVVGDLHSAGSETTSTTLTWAVLYLMKNPEIQEKFRNEIDRVVGSSRPPTLVDKLNMPYTEAVMLEILRITSIVPMGLFHTAMTDTHFYGYFIPKGTQIIGNLYHAHHNPDIWGDPETFRPERFLSDDEKSVIKNEALMPFAVGKRACLGEQLARDEFFLFLTSIFQRFQVEQDPSNPPSLEPEVGFLLVPKVFTVVMKDRLE